MKIQHHPAREPKRTVDRDRPTQHHVSSDHPVSVMSNMNVELELPPGIASFWFQRLVKPASEGWEHCDTSTAISDLPGLDSVPGLNAKCKIHIHFRYVKFQVPVRVCLGLHLSISASWSCGCPLLYSLGGYV